MPSFSANNLRRVVHVLYPETKLLDVTGPLQVFHDARDSRGNPCYQSVLVSAKGGDICTDTGIELSTRTLSKLRLRTNDIVLVPGGQGVFEASKDRRLVAWLRQRAARVACIGSTCTGAFLLAEAGLLDGRRAVTHWDDCAELQRKHPEVQVEVDPIFLEDRGIWTSAGVTAGIDLALALVEKDLGREAVLDLARRLVVYCKRSGGQSQFSNRLRQQVQDEGNEFAGLHEWIGRHLKGDLRVQRLAERVDMSARNFHRTYTKEMGVTPARMVLGARVEAARHCLEDSQLGIAGIALRCGFGTEERMRRAFQRTLGLSPSDYRQKWC